MLLAETVKMAYTKQRVIEYLKADWQGLADVQLATLNWVDGSIKACTQCTGLCIAF